jgi:oligopeptide transport system substrate-binding protein
LIEQCSALLNGFLNNPNLKTRMETMLPEEKAWKQRLERITDGNLSPRDEQENPQLMEQYAQLLSRIAYQHPLLIIIDDLQWMDAGTGRLLFHLVRRLQNSRILFAGAYRQEEVSSNNLGTQHPLQSLLNEFQSSFGKITIDLDQTRISSGRNFIDAYIDSEPNRLDENFRRELYRRTQGHPLFTIQILRNFQEREEIQTDKQKRWVASSSLDWDNLPPQVEGVIGERIGRLNQELQELLSTASVEGEQFTIQVLEQVQGKKERKILHDLSTELEKRHRLIQELGVTNAGGQKLVRYRFVHTLIQQYLYQQIGKAERAVFHREIAETLEKIYKEELDNVAALLANHYQQAGIKEKAVHYFIQAGDQARALYAHQEAIKYYQQAIGYLKEMGEITQTARTLMKLYLVYHNTFDFPNAQIILKEYDNLFRKSGKQHASRHETPIHQPYRLATLKQPILDPALCNTIFDLELLKELFCGLVEWSEDQNIIPSVAENWDVLDSGRRYIFHLKQGMRWSDGEPITAMDFDYAWKRVLDPATQALAANLLYDIRGAKEFNQGQFNDPSRVGIHVIDPVTLEVILEEPCGYFPYIFADPVMFAIPKHLIERESSKWILPDRIVTNGAFRLDCHDWKAGNTIHFSRNPYFSGEYNGNIEQITLTSCQNETEMYQEFVAGELDMVEFLIAQMKLEELKHYQKQGQLFVSTIPFVDAIYFIADRAPFNNPDIRRAFVLATDRERLAREVENQIPATGGYIPPGLAGYSADSGLPYDPREAQRILTDAGYPHGRGFPSLGLLLGLVGLKKGDDLVFASLQRMWEENLGITVQPCWSESDNADFDTCKGFNFFFIGWMADYPDPASFLKTNFLIGQSHWKNPEFGRLVENGNHTLDQDQRMEYYRKADRILIEEAAILPLFYGHLYELRQPWIQRLKGSSIYNPQWKDIVLLPH